MPNEFENEFTIQELLDRGWTRTLIKRFMPRPDGCYPVNHWANFRGKDTYSAVKVWNIEQSDEFGQAFLKTWKGRWNGAPHFSSLEEALVKMRATPHPTVPKRSKEEIKQATLLAALAGEIMRARNAGYRTPHGC